VRRIAAENKLADAFKFADFSHVPAHPPENPSPEDLPPCDLQSIRLAFPSRGSSATSTAGVAEWQTRRIQNPVRVTSSAGSTPASGTSKTQQKCWVFSFFAIECNFRESSGRPQNTVKITVSGVVTLVILSLQNGLLEPITFKVLAT